MKLRYAVRRETPAAPLKGKKAKECEGVEGTWETVCVSTEDMYALSKELKKGKTRGEKDLAKLLNNELAPLVESTRAARERQDKKQRELESMPRKRSSRIASVVRILVPSGL